jgi:hypothetical protein
VLGGLTMGDELGPRSCFASFENSRNPGMQEAGVEVREPRKTDTELRVSAAPFVLRRAAVAEGLVEPPRVGSGREVELSYPRFDGAPGHVLRTFSQLRKYRGTWPSVSRWEEPPGGLWKGGA